jgi:Na+/melibiose symporter-like transporter
MAMPTAAISATILVAAISGTRRPFWLRLSLPTLILVMAIWTDDHSGDSHLGSHSGDGHLD